MAGQYFPDAHPALENPLAQYTCFFGPWRMNVEQPVLFLTWYGDAFLIDGECVRRCRTAEVNSTHDFCGKDRPMPGSRTLSLVDSEEPVPKSILSPTLFFVSFITPVPSRFQLEKQDTHPCGALELFVIMTTPGMMSAGRTWSLDQVREVRRKVGPCPRDVRSWLQDSLKFNHDVLAALLSLSTPESFIELARPAPAPSSIISNALIAVWRAGNVDPSVLLQDSAIIVAFKPRQSRRR
ncbi:hypothetical protein K466DRAFT_266802 [Polyporus arcularius HHB13444]|uniref:Uncharacterized protein n=1 Tax=Polyporus arcularius HHB13444 TaxID=1314778 RepID=A0A5C3PW23_9APHY|nr:hypothetical protein K466DRAFT_266802 [Polyporus arcularius HHB13444]